MDPQDVAGSRTNIPYVLSRYKRQGRLKLCRRLLLDKRAESGDDVAMRDLRGAHEELDVNKGRDIDSVHHLLKVYLVSLV